jgi:hypothetical protein
VDKVWKQGCQRSRVGDAYSEPPHLAAHRLPNVFPSRAQRATEWRARRRPARDLPVNATERCVRWDSRAPNSVSSACIARLNGACVMPSRSALRRK